MRETRQYGVYPSNLEPLAAFTGLHDHMVRSGYQENPKACKNIEYVVRVDSTRTLETYKYSEFLEILGRHPRPKDTRAHSHWTTGSAGDLGCIVDLDPGSLQVIVESTDLNLLAGTHDIVRQLFDASNPPKERNELLSRMHLKKSVFLAHRFDDGGRACATIVSHFLGRLGFDVKEGEGYEARDIPRKVIERIEAQDVFLCLATPGDHHWILSEASFAKARDKYVIVICEEGVTFSKGILGSDFEYLTYPAGFVEKMYVELLYALPT
jgi:hypothetical protein